MSLRRWARYFLPQLKYFSCCLHVLHILTDIERLLINLSIPNSCYGKPLLYCLQCCFAYLLLLCFFRCHDGIICLLHDCPIIPLISPAASMDLLARLRIFRCYYRKTFSSITCSGSLNGGI